MFAAHAQQSAYEGWHFITDRSYCMAALAQDRCRYLIESRFRHDRFWGRSRGRTMIQLRNLGEVDRLCLATAGATIYRSSKPIRSRLTPISSPILDDLIGFDSR